MARPLVIEDQCSHMFFSEILRLYGVLPLRVHGTIIEAIEGVDVIYIIEKLKDLQNRESKLLLVQEKAAYTPAYTFQLTKNQHDRILRRQKLFANRAYLYGFFCVKDFYELFQVFVRTLFVDAARIPQFHTSTKNIRGSLQSYSISGRNFTRTGYPFAEILRRFVKCYIGLPNEYFRMLTEDLYDLLERKLPFHLLTYDIEKNVVEVISPRRFKEKHTEDNIFFT